MTGYAPIKSKLPPGANPAPGPESKAERMTGDCEAWGERAAEPGPEGEDLLKPGKFLQATGDWTAQGLSKIDAKTQPSRRPEDPLSTGPGAIKT
jgi:hypothetical protein